MSNFQIPQFFRVLIIDDKVALDQTQREFFRNAFTTVAREKAQKLIPVDVVFESDPAEGFMRWQQEPFDLTLIDSDFRGNRKSTGEVKSQDDFQNYVLSAKDQGFNILQLLHNSVNQAGKLPHRKNMCCFYLWSGMEWKPLNDTEAYIPSLFKQHALDQGEYFISKDSNWKSVWPCGLKTDANGFQHLQNIIRKGVKRVQDSDFDELQTMERFLLAYKNNYFGIQKEIAGGCLIYDEKGKFPFLKKLREDGEFVVCPTRIPSFVLDENIPFIPSAMFSPQEGIRFAKLILKGKGSEIYYIEHFRKRSLLESDRRIPVYQDKSNVSQTTRNKSTGNQQAKILGHPIKNPFIAAVTPLTSTTVIGHHQAIEALHDKVIALLEGPFGAVILKTVYLDGLEQWNGVHWPAIQVQSHNRTRCLFPYTGTATIWNTGRTALEMLHPVQLNQLLKNLLESNGDVSHRVMVSLGSKFRSEWPVAQYANFSTLWMELFKQVFGDLSGDKFPLVEINVRHFLREIVKEWVGGDEYLHPHDLKTPAKNQERQFREEFNLWLHALHDTAVRFKKKIILKFPHRSDTLSFVQSAIKLRKHHLGSCSEKDADFGVRGVTLVNALKVPVPHAENVEKYSKEWYAHPWAWQDASDKTFKYQMSGGYLVPYRNQLLAGLIDSLSEFEQYGMEILLSGGITSREDVNYLQGLDRQQKVITGFQIGTRALIKTCLKNNEKQWKTASNVLPSSSKKETGQELPERPEQKSITPRISFCNVRKCERCGKCCRSFYCDSFIDRVNISNCLTPFMDSRNCSGCGLCVQLCIYGALHLYRPIEMLVLISSSIERQEILRSEEIPFIAYNSIDDLDRFSHIFDLNFSNKIKSACRDGCSTEELMTIIDTIWRIRLEDKFLLGAGREKLYPDNRKMKNAGYHEQCKTGCSKLIKRLDKKTITPAEKRTISRAVLWSQLIWSDPGQVLWDSHILTLQTVLKDTNSGNCISLSGDNNQLPYKDLKGRNLSISSYVVLMRRAEILFNGWLESNKFQLKDVDDERMQKYNESKMGIDRLAGLDVRACGDFLISNFSNYEKKDRQAMAGLPWEMIGDKVKGAHKEAFATLCKAISLRG